MAHEVILPKQGQSVETCLILGWKKKVGDAVQEGEALVEVETDKASFEIPAPASGTLLAIFHEQGEDVAVLTPLALIGQPGEVPQPSSSAPAPVAQAAPTAPAAPAARAKLPQRAGGRLAISPRARRLAERSGLSSSEAAAAPAGPVAPAAQAAAQPAGDFPGPFAEIPVKGVRKIIAERMLASLAGSAQYTLNAWANAEVLTAYRQRLKSSDESLGLRNITIGDLVNFAAVRALAAHPEANAHFAAGRLLQFQRVHLGFAVDTPRGLLVPVIRNADSLSLKKLAVEAARLAQACQDGTVSPEALSGGTFTVSNLGALGVEHFTPVLNPPQVAILGVGSIGLKPVADPGAPGSVAFKPHIALSLTANHQVLDGAPAARFLAELARNIENIGLLLAG